VRQEDQGPFTRVRPFDAKRTCLLLIDVQNYVWNPDVAKRLPYFDSQVRDVVLPNLKQLIDAFRRAGAEIIYTVIENLTKDGRDRSLDYKLSDFWAPEHERVLLWSDPKLGIRWPIKGQPILSPRDAKGAKLAEAEVFP